MGKPTTGPEAALPWDGSVPKPVRRMWEQGYSVIPQRYEDGGKIPLYPYKEWQEKRPPWQVVEDWALANPGCLWAVVVPQDECRLDFDVQHGAAEGWVGLSPAIWTPHGGVHVAVKVPARVKSSRQNEVHGIPGLEILGHPHLATFYGDGYEEGMGETYALDDLPPSLRDAIEGLMWTEDDQQTAEIPEGFDDFTPLSVILREMLNKVKAGETRNEVGFWGYCQARDERYDIDEVRQFALERYLPQVTDLGNHPYRQGEAFESVMSAFSRPPREPRGLRLSPEDRLEERRQQIRITRQANRDVDQEEATAAFVAPPSRRDGVEEMAVEDGPENDRLNALLKENQIALLAGPQKAGKTIALMNCGLDMINGDFFLGRFAARALDGLLGYWNYEVDERQWRQWARRMGWGAVQRRWAVNHLAGYSMYLETDVAAEYAIEWLRSRGVEVWIIDIMNRAFGGNWQSDNQETYRFFERLEQIRREAGVSEIVMSSQFSVHGQGRAGGCAALDAAPSVLWTLSKHASKRTFSAFGRGVDVGEQDFSFDSETLRLSSGSGQNRRSLKETGLILQALQVARSYPGSGKNALKGRMEGGRNQDFNNAIADAVLAGFLRVEKSGQSDLHYLTQDGEEHLALHVGGR